MKKDKKQNYSYVDKVLSLILPLIAIAILLAFTFIQFLRLLVTCFPIIEISAVGSEETWLLFLGSLFGGSITLVALAITLQQTSQIKQDEKAISIMPVCIASTPLARKIPHFFQNITVVNFSNVSNNIAKEVTIQSFEVIAYKSSSQDDIYKSFSASNDELSRVSNTINPNQDFHFQSYCFYLNQAEIDTFVKRVDIKVTLNYSDIFELKKYTLNFTSTFDLNEVANQVYINEEGKEFMRRQFVFRNEINHHK